MVPEESQANTRQGCVGGPWCRKTAALDGVDSAVEEGRGEDRLWQLPRGCNIVEVPESGHGRGHSGSEGTNLGVDVS